MTPPIFPRRHPSTGLWTLFTVVLAVAAGCSTPARTSPGSPAAAPAHDDSPSSVETAGPDRLAAASRPAGAAVLVVDGDPVAASALWADLAEAGGGAVVREFVLDRRLRTELSTRGLSVDSAAIDRERRLLADSLAATGSTGAAADELVLRLRRAQGLGERRFAALLERTAMLRALVAPQAQVTDANLAQAHAIAYGPKHRARLIVVRTQADAAALRRELAGSGDQLAAVFSRLALERSIDESGPRAGVLPPISVEDPLWPSALRAALAELRPGELSPVLALERGFAVALLDAVDPGSGPSLDEARPRLEQQVRLRQERLLMDREAARLLQGGRGVTVLDPSLSWGWTPPASPGR